MSDDIRAIPATIAIEQHFKDELVNDIREQNYLGFESSHNEELFLYALALGWTQRMKPEVKRKASGGWARTESFTPKLCTCIDLLHYIEMGLDKPDELRDRKRAYKLAEEYANGGFLMMEQEMKSEPDSEQAAHELVEWMDRKYREFFA